MSKVKKTLQLGMNPSTASGRLVKDTLFRLAIETGHKCFQCGGELERDTFSVEHKTPWLDSDNPRETFFDQGNIAFSHIGCNVGARRSEPTGLTQADHQKNWRDRNKEKNKAARRDKYLRNGT